MDSRKTFVLWVGGSDEEAGMQGRLEDVDTGRQFRFRSLDELMALLKERVEEDSHAKH